MSVDAEAELSAPGRLLLALAAAAHLVTGVPLFVAPEWAADHFAWTVSPFVAMTAGGWCLGTAGFAGYAVAARRWPAIRPCVVYVTAFGLLQLGVAVYERDLLRTGEVLTWPYLAALGLSLVGGLVALADARRWLGPDRRPDGLQLTPLVRGVIVFFVVFVSLLALVAAVAPRRATDGSIFPEPLSLFSLRAFGAFYLALALAVAALVGDRRADGYVASQRCGIVLVLPILAATVAYADTFTIGEHPLQVAYPAAYVAALVGASIAVWWARSSTQIISRPTSSGVRGA